MSPRSVAATIQYSDCLREVEIQVVPRRAGWVTQDVYLVCDWIPLRRWCEGWASAKEPSLESAGDSMALALAAALPLEVLGSHAWTLTSVIQRDTAQGTGPTHHAHRDLDELAAANLGGVGFANAWIPLDVVRADPLAVVDPATVLPAQRASFRGYSTSDRTGLRAPAAHEPPHDWKYVPGLRPGDALLWRSDVVYHAAFELTGQSATRRSCDVRFVAAGRSPD